MKETLYQFGTPEKGVNGHVDHPRCDADGYYYCLKIDGGVYADGYTATREEAVSKFNGILNVKPSKLDVEK